MNLKKPKFWDYKKPNFHMHIYFSINFLIQLLIFKKNFKKKKNLKLKQFV